jgi:hypothetical protein
MKVFRVVSGVLFLAALSSCTSDSGSSAGGGASRAAMSASIGQEPKGAYYVGRRYYKKDYKFWGFIRESGAPWSTARLVMMNENSKLAPDREGGLLGSDNNYEYKLVGEFTGQTVYEPASNGFYPEFRLKGFELLNATPATIYHEAGATNPERRIIAKPY